MTTIVEKRDPFTAGHQTNVSILAARLAEEMGISKEDIEGIRIMGLLHDVGKIAVPIEILSKPGQITKDEMNIIKAHPEVGYNILKDINFPGPVSKVVLQHHERMDGSGYPNQLIGDEILLEARILAVADVVEAMHSHRPYRPALGIKKALDEIRKNKGVLYDATVVEVCLRLFNEKKFHFMDSCTKLSIKSGL